MKSPILALDILACPLCKSPLVLTQDETGLVCKAERLRFPIHNGVPWLLSAKAVPLSIEAMQSQISHD